MNAGIEIFRSFARLLLLRILTANLLGMDLDLASEMFAYSQCSTQSS
jgi:hypothetical protein